MSEISKVAALETTDAEPGDGGPDAPIDWTIVVQEHQDWMRRVIIARTGSADLVDDVVQDVSLAVARSQARPRLADEVAPWLCKIVVRQCALAARSQARHQRKLDGFRQTRASGDTRRSDPMLWLLAQEERELVHRALEMLDAKGRQLLVWKYVHGLTYREIAARLAVSVHTAEYRVIDARKRLRRWLHEQGIDGDVSP